MLLYDYVGLLAIAWVRLAPNGVVCNLFRRNTKWAIMLTR